MERDNPQNQGKEIKPDLGGEKFSYKAPNFYATVHFKILHFTSSWYNLEMGEKIPVKIHSKNGAQCH